jgi:hypothetical protein
MSICPITREYRENLSNVFSCKRGKSVVCFEAQALIDYILFTGDFTDPESRIPFLDEDLQRLDEIGKVLKKPSVLESRIHFNYSEKEFMINALIGLERYCGELVENLYNLLEITTSDSYSFEINSSQLEEEILPEFSGAIYQLLQADSQLFEHTISSCEAFLKGQRNTIGVYSRMQDYVLLRFRETVAEVRVRYRDEYSGH